MKNGLFIMLYKEEDLKLYLKNNLYGFLVKPLMEDRPTSRSNYFKMLADYACGRGGTQVFFFLDRKIVYGGEIVGHQSMGAFYLNGDTSPLGRNSNAQLFWDESTRYTSTDKSGIFLVPSGENNELKAKAQPFIIKFLPNENTGKFITSDDLYFELGEYSYPLPSNTVQGMGFCTLTPGESQTCLSLINNSNQRINFLNAAELIDDTKLQIVFNSNMIDITNFISESELEFDILSDLSCLRQCIDLNKEYVACRQVPISPFKPMNMDRADICLYDVNNQLANGTLPNVLIELKKDRANKDAYMQVVRYLKWLQKIISETEFDQIEAIIIAKSFKIRSRDVVLDYQNKIKMYSIETNTFYELE